MRGTEYSHQQQGNLGKANKNSMLFRCVLSFSFCSFQPVGGEGGGGRQIGGVGAKEGNRHHKTLSAYLTAGEN